MNCDLCGRNSELISAIVEGSLLNVCPGCSKFGNVVAVNKNRPIIQNKVKKIMRDDETIEIVVEDFSAKIKEAREKLGLNQEDMAKRLNEKESLLHKIESGSIKPSLELARKLEKVLNLKLVEKYTEEQKRKVDFKDEGLTIGDLIKIKQKK